MMYRKHSADGWRGNAAQLELWPVGTWRDLPLTASGPQEIAGLLSTTYWQPRGPLGEAAEAVGYTYEGQRFSLGCSRCGIFSEKRSGDVAARLLAHLWDVHALRRQVVAEVHHG